MSSGPELVILGNLFVDDIVLHDGRTLMAEPGGAVLHAALAANLWGARVGIVSVVGTDYPRSGIGDDGGARDRSCGSAAASRTWRAGMAAV